MEVRRYLTAVLAATALYGGSEEAQLEEMKARIAALEAKSKTHNSKGSLELKTSDTVLSVGGRIRMDTVYNDPDMGESGGGTHEFIFSPKSIATSAENTGSLGMTAKESRFWVKTRRPTEYGMLFSLIETDFYGSSGNETGSNSHGPRLRHAYLNLANLTVGQTNSTFMGSGVPDTIKAPVDDVVIRQPLIRWESEMGSSGSMQFALEQPETLLNENGSNVAVNDDKLPDFVAKYDRYGRWGEVSLAALVRQIRVDRDYNDQNRSQAETAAALHFSGRLRVGEGDTVRFGIAGGRGLGRYIAGATGAYADGSIEPDNTIRLHTVIGGHLAYQHWWSKTLRSNLAYGYVDSRNDSSVDPDSDRRSSSTHVNLRWLPIQNGEIGVEYIDATRELESGERFFLKRLQLVMSYDF